MHKLQTILSRSAIPAFVCLGLLAAGIAFTGGNEPLAHNVLLCTLSIGALPLLWEILQSIRKGHFGVDIIAIVAIGTSLAIGEYLAGTVILLMLSGGEALEEFALKRARKELTDLIARAPQVAHKKTGADLHDVPVTQIVAGDIVIVKPGEIVPVDGEVIDGVAMVDESALTGEAVPLRKAKGMTVMSGSVAQDALLTIRTLKPSSESKYAQIIRLVREAEDRRAPFVRLADRYSVWFTAATFVLALLAWLLSHSPERLLAVLVVATPCPLILATPIAFAAGISRAAKRGIIVRNGGALQKLGEARSLVFDKTGTLTLGVPALSSIDAFGAEKNDVLMIAASLDQFSAHILARSLVQEAAKLNLNLLEPDNFAEVFGEGVSGVINGKKYFVGRLRFLEAQKITVPDGEVRKHKEAQEKGQMTVYVATENALLGVLFFADHIRPNVKSLFTHLKTLGITSVTMLTGDRKAVALQIASEIGLQENQVIAECLPEDKVKEVQKLHTSNGPVVMVGDGINDAPALAAADVGIAMGAHGATASSEAGDIVIMVDQIERVGEALCIGHRVLQIALQSVRVGIGLSLILMIIAALGYIPPVMGALLQEVIDVAVILNALRVLLTRCEFLEE